MPKDAEYTVSEALVEGFIPVDDMTGTIAENVGTTGEPGTVASFTNVCAVCKLTDESGKLLYYKDEAGALLPAVFGSVQDAFDFLAKEDNPDKEPRNVEMLVSAYSLAEGITVPCDMNVTLTTADSTDADEEDGYPYTGTAGTPATIARSANYGAMITSSGNLTLKGITLDGAKANYTATGDGGIVKVTAGSLIVAENATLQNSAASGNGGAIYAAAEDGKTATVTVSGGTVNGNRATNGGAGIYLAEGSTLKLSGSPDFGGTDTDATGNIKGAAGNFKDGSPIKATNGQKPYAKARQDIFLAGYDTADATSIVIAGALNVDKGSIWVWAEKTAHHKMLKQFAVFDDELIKDGEVNLSEDELKKTFEAFRNAQSDTATRCGADFLTGQSGKEVKNLYWTGGFDFSFLKVDGAGNALKGATFALYTDPGCAAEQVKAVSADGTDAYKDDEGVKLDEGVVFFSKLAPNTEGAYYYMKETAEPSGYAKNDTVYRLQIKADRTAELMVRSEGATTNAAADYTEEVYKVQTVAATTTTPAQYRYQIANISEISRRVMLRKASETDGAYTGLSGARFIVYRADLTEVRDNQKTEDGKPVGYYEPDGSGVYFSGELPYGVYYLLETKAPEGYSGNAGKVFKLTVNGSGVTVTEPETVKKVSGADEAAIAEAFRTAMVKSEGD